tara:strand:- start:1177 stop:1515 length:339 start_codon:yes stop_codon:yes gene_type:complete
MKIYHNPRCRKSREAIQYLTEKEVLFEIVEYMKEGISENKMKLLLNKLNISALQLTRKNEKIWKEKFKEKKLNEGQIINILCSEPKLMERPIIESKKRAVIGRSKENIDKIL